MVAGAVALFVPGDRPERFAKARQAGADIVIVDLEDAVSHESKSGARVAMRDAGLDWSSLVIRINAADSAFYADDLALLAQLRPAAVMLPKAEHGPALMRLAGNLAVIALVETARGLAGARVLAATPGVARLAFGSIDFCADLGCAHERDVLLPPRLELVLASRLAGLEAPLDGVTANFRDTVLVEDDARHAQSVGMGGKLCIHPAQIVPCRAGFHPSEVEIAWARSIVQSDEAGAAAIDGQMVDAPVRKRAAAILRRAGL